jgi:hypothetical protein
MKLLTIIFAFSILLVGCTNYDDIKENHIVWFRTKAEAEQVGFRMARNC